MLINFNKKNKSGPVKGRIRVKDRFYFLKNIIGKEVCIFAYHKKCGNGRWIKNGSWEAIQVFRCDYGVFCSRSVDFIYCVREDSFFVEVYLRRRHHPFSVQLYFRWHPDRSLRFQAFKEGHLDRFFCSFVHVARVMGGTAPSACSGLICMSPFIS